jgi:hypothetical protein
MGWRQLRQVAAVYLLAPPHPFTKAYISIPSKNNANKRKKKKH